MFPTGGSSSTVTDGDSFTVYVQAYKGGVTDAPGQGADISCSLLWSEVDIFGGAWLGATTTPMTYNVDIGNNDEYQAAITPPPGLYEFTTFCTDLTDGTDFYQGAGNGRLTVNADPTTPSQTRALWVEKAIIAWNSVGAATYELHYDFAGALTAPSPTTAAACRSPTAWPTCWRWRTPG